jgi:hypothetical protein
MPQRKESQESSPHIPRQIPFYEDGAAVKLRTIKHTTIRLPADKYKGFQAGDEIIGACDGEEISLIVWGVLENVPIGQMHPDLLALDGYPSLEEAINDLKTYGGKYGEINKNTPMTMIAIISEQQFKEFTPDAQRALLSQQDGKRLQEVINDERLTGYFEDVLKRQRQAPTEPAT